MSFAKRLASGGFPVALEITPPQRSLPAVLLRRARLLDPWCAAVNVIHRPDRQSSLDACIELREAGQAAAWHLVARGRSRESLAPDLERARAASVDLVLCILGDHGAGEGPPPLPVREVVAAAREALPGAVIGATFNQHGPDMDAAHRNLAVKLRAGATYVQTQPVFDLEALRAHAERVKAAAPESAIVAMVMPLLTPESAARIGARLEVGLPEELGRRIEAGPQAAWGAFDETVARLAESPLVDGIAVMTFEMDPPADTGRRIGEALAAAGIAPASEAVR